MRLFRSVLALALASNLISASANQDESDDASITTEVASFTGTCSEASCTNVSFDQDYCVFISRSKRYKMKR